MSGGLRWEPWEDDILRASYPQEGREGVAARLRANGSDRTRGAVRFRAHVLGVKGRRGPRPTTPNPRAWTPEQERIVRDTYREGGADAARAALAAAGHERSRAAVRGHAFHLGVTTPHWTPIEDAILRERYKRDGVHATRAALLAIGSDRGVYAIRSRVGHMRRRGIWLAAPRPVTVAEAVLGQLAALPVGELLDTAGRPRPVEKALAGLARRRLAKREGPGLWRATLRGLIEAREPSPVRQDARRAPSGSPHGPLHPETRHEPLNARQEEAA